MIIKLFALSLSFGTIIVILSKLLNFSLKLFVSRLGVENFGDYYLVIATVTSLTTLVSLGIPMSLTRFLSYLRNNKEKQSVLSSSLTLTLLSASIAGLLLFIVTNPLFTFTETTQISIYLQILSLSLIGGTFTSIVRAYYLGILRVKHAYITEAIDVIGKFIGVLTGMLWIKAGVLGAVSGYTLGTLGSACINAVRLFKREQIPIITTHISHRLIGFAWPVGASEVLTTITNTALVYALRAGGGGDNVGLYAAATSIAALIHLLPQMIFSVFLPFASGRHATGKPLYASYRTLMFWLYIVVVPPTLVLTLMSPSIISILFGQSFANASSTLSILAIAYGVYALIVWPNRQILDAAGFTKHNLLLTVLRISSMFIVLLFFFPPTSSAALAKTVAIGWLAEGLGAVYIAKKKQCI